jgi:hypothetical protein
VFAGGGTSSLSFSASFSSKCKAQSIDQLNEQIPHIEMQVEATT